MDLAKNLKVECVSRLQPKPPLQVSPRQSVAEAVSLMRKEGMGCVLVCEGGKLLGIFTERDLMRRVLAPQRPLTVSVGEVMTRDPVAVNPKQAIGVAVQLMEVSGHRHLPVVSEQGEAVGILSVKRIVRYLVEHFPATVYNLPPEPGTVQHEREGA